MTQTFTKDNTVLAKLFAEEDIHVVHRQAHTASFDVKKRELVLPILKFMSKDIQDLMTLHEVGHAFWTTVDMMRETSERKIHHSIVNILEDVRIEKMIQEKYKGSKVIFKRGYQELIKNNFFETKGKDINSYNLIDRINLHFKHHENVEFSDDEMVWVKKADATKTCAEVLDLAEELHTFMKEQQESQESMTDNHNMSASSGESGDGESGEGMEGFGEDSGEQEMKEILQDPFTSETETEESGGSESGETDESESDSSESTDGESDDGSEEKSSGSDGEETEDTTDEKTTTSDVTNSIEREGGSGGNAPEIRGLTDDASYNSTQKMRDKEVSEIQYASIPKIDLDKVIVDYQTVSKVFNKAYSKPSGNSEQRYIDSNLEELNTHFKDNKKIISYMVKEFEMKKAADQYARASVSKTGTLDMGRLHTYKFNDDLFRKVTTLPGATNHGFVLFLDWSGSMAWNLTNTLKQLFNIVHFCNRVKIPFDVYAFSTEWEHSTYSDRLPEVQKFKVGDLKINPAMRLLNMLSSNMTKNEQNKMMHNLLMFSNSMVRYRDWSKYGYPIYPARCTRLGGTPLNDAIVCAMDIVPQFRTKTGVQKVHSIFLTDGDSMNISSKFDIVRKGGSLHNPEYGEGIANFSSYGNAVYTDPVTNNRLTCIDEDPRNWRRNDQTVALLKILKKRVEGMNVVGFFIANSTRGGQLPKDIIESKFNINKFTHWNKFKMILDEVKRTNVAVCKTEGYDEFYIVPGQVQETTDEIEVDRGANKSALKRAFMKSANNRMKAKPLLNKFISMVA